jgi:hypothetical protein
MRKHIGADVETLRHLYWDEGNLELMSQSDHRLKEMFCQNCPLRKEIRLLRWEMKQLREQLQYKLREE